MMPIAILSGGLGTRLGQLTKRIPKCMVSVHGKPFVDWQIELLKESGYTDFVYCLSHHSDQIIRHLKDGSDYGVTISYSIDGPTRLGTGGALKSALPKLGNAFAVIYGDSYLPIDYKGVETRFVSSQQPMLMTIFKNDRKFDSSNVEYSRGALVSYSKKQTSRRMKYIDYGLSYFSRETFDDFPNQTFFDLDLVMSTLVDRKNVEPYVVSERFYEIGSLQGLVDFSNYLANKEIIK